MRISKTLTLAVFVVLMAAACSSGGGSAKSASSSSESTSSEPTSSSSAQASVAPQDVLTSLALKDGDLPAGVTLRLIPGGDQVEGQVTMDMCGADFPSEQLRTNRLQEIAKDASNVTVVNDENVRYRSSQGADQAMSEVRQAVSECDPSQFVNSHVSGIPPLQYQLVVIPESQLSGLAQDHFAIAATLTAQSGETHSSVLIYQRRGAMLVGIYGPTVDQLLPFAQIAATRLAALSATDAGE
jgi:hypothetical protein